MKLQPEQIANRLKNPKNAGEVGIGNLYESKLRIFTEPKFEEDLKKETAWKSFLDYIAKTITPEKGKRIEEYVITPLSVCAISKGVLSDLYKVFNAGNSFFKIDTVKKNGGEKLEKSLVSINIDSWIEEQGKKVLKNRPNTVVVVDKTEEGEPYLLAVGNDRLIDFAFKDDSKIELDYVVFLHSKEENEEGKEIVRVSYYDAFGYYVFIEQESGGYELEKESPHNLGYCPARMFLEERLNSNNTLNRDIPMAWALSKLQEWQLFDIYKLYTDHYAPFPVVEMVRAKCTNANCVDGKVHTQSEYFADGERRQKLSISTCTICSNQNTVGIGTKILLDPPKDKDEPTAAGRFRMISPEVENLKYIADKLDSIEAYIKLKVVGEDSILSTEAVNEKQVKGSFESKTNILLSIKTNLDSLYKWIAKTIAGLVIGNKPITVTANFGTEWYLVGENELQERYKAAKESGLPKEEIDMIYNQLIETKYKGNPSKIMRLRLMNALNPLPYDTYKEKIEKRGAGVASQRELLMSEKMIFFVKMFEEENGSLIEFGELLSPQERVKQISLIINKYVDEYIKQNSSEPSGDS